MHQSICPHLTVKALLIILPKSSVIESRQWNGKQKIKKHFEDACQKVKSKTIIHRAPFLEKKKGWRPQGSNPCPPPTQLLSEPVNRISLWASMTAHECSLETSKFSS